VTYAVGGFDKILELELVNSETPIHYIESAHIYDEKLVNQKFFLTNEPGNFSSVLLP
jgi:hypothetical protein